MALCKTDAIILHSRKQGETSKILSMYTLEFGKLSVMAKGSRGIRSKHTGALETFSHVSIIFYYKQERGLQYLSQVSLLSRFPSLFTELGKLSLASIPCEIIARTEDEGHPNPELYSLLLHTLQAIDQAGKASKQIIRAFKLKFLSISGFEPEFHCLQCGKAELEPVNRFSVSQGGYCCSSCPPPDEPVSVLNRHAMQLLSWFLKVPIEQTSQAVCSKDTAEQMDSFLHDLLCYHIDTLCQLKSEQYLKQLENGLGKKGDFKNQ